MARQSGGGRGVDADAQLITEAWAASVLPRRVQGAHKWDVGGVVVVAGSPPYAGAAALCCAGASRSGAGIVSVALPRSIAGVVVGLVPEATVVMLPEGDSTGVARRAAEAIETWLERGKAMVVGPGLGDDDATEALLDTLFGTPRGRSSIGFGPSAATASDVFESVVARTGTPVVVDADGLNWLAKRDGWWEQLSNQRLVLTPHVGEMARLVKSDVETILADPLATARDAAERWNQVVVLKGAKTLVASPAGEVVYVETPPVLATAGSGDVMSGAIGAFLAQGLTPRDAAALAVYAGSRAAGRLQERLGTLGVVAGDLPLAIAEELNALERLEA